MRNAKNLISVTCLVLCLLLLGSMLAPASAAMVELELVQEERLFTEVHYSASASSTVIGTLADGAQITVIGEKSGFYRITCAGMRGYVSKDQTVVDENGFYYVNCAQESGETRSVEGLDQQSHDALINELLAQAERHLGTRYVYGGTRPGGFDCSGYVMYVFGKSGISLNRTCSDQLSQGMMVAKEDLQPGDLVFFQGTTGGRKLSSHVGIYVGDGQFIHSANKGVRYDDLDSTYWSRHYLTARRVVVTGTAAITSELPQENTRSVDRSVGAFFLSPGGENGTGVYRKIRSGWYIGGSAGQFRSCSSRMACSRCCAVTQMQP